MRPGLLRVPAAGVGGVLSDIEPVRLDERVRSRGLRAGGLRLGNTRSAFTTAALDCVVTTNNACV